MQVKQIDYSMLERRFHFVAAAETPSRQFFILSSALLLRSQTGPGPFRSSRSTSTCSLCAPTSPAMRAPPRSAVARMALAAQEHGMWGFFFCRPESDGQCPASLRPLSARGFRKEGVPLRQ